MTGTLSVKLDFSTLHVEANSVVEVPKGFSQGISNRNCFHEISKRFFVGHTGWKNLLTPCFFKPVRSFRRSTISDWSFTFSNIQSVHVQSMVCWPSIESKGSLDGHVGLVRALKPRNLLAWTYSEKVMHACLQMHVGWFGYQFRAKITLWYVPNAVFKRLFTFKLINLCVLNFALDLVEFSSKLESIYICCKKNIQIASSN